LLCPPFAFSWLGFTLDAADPEPDPEGAADDDTRSSSARGESELESVLGTLELGLELKPNASSERGELDDPDEDPAPRELGRSPRDWIVSMSEDEVEDEDGRGAEAVGVKRFRKVRIVRIVKMNIFFC